MLNDIQKKIVKSLQEELPLKKKPFASLSHQLDISEEELLQELRYLKEEGYLRRIGAILYHRRAGFTHNAMVAWRVDEEFVKETGEKMASSPHTTHVYQRKAYPQWPYNLYTMIHGQSKMECHEIAQKLSRVTGVKDYTLLFSTQEFKKASMKYY